MYLVFLHPGHSLTLSCCFLLLTWSLLCSLAPTSYSPEASFRQACILCQLNAAKTKLAALAFCIPEAPRPLLDYLQPFRVEKPNVISDPLSPPLCCLQLRRQTTPLGSNIGTATPSKGSMTQQALAKSVGMHCSPLMRPDADIGPSQSNSSSTAATTGHGAVTDRHCTSKQADNFHASTSRRNTKPPQKARQPSQPVSSPKTPDFCDVLAGLKADKAVPLCDARSACNADLTGKALGADAARPPTASTYTKASVLAALAAAEVDKAHRAASPAVGSSARQAGQVRKCTKSTSADWASASNRGNPAPNTVRAAPKPVQSALGGQVSDAADAFAAPDFVSTATKAGTPKQQTECTDQASVSSSMPAAVFSLLDTFNKANTAQKTAHKSACADDSAIANVSTRLDMTKQARKGKPSAPRKTSASASKNVSKLEGLSRLT